MARRLSGRAIAAESLRGTLSQDEMSPEDEDCRRGAASRGLDNPTGNYDAPLIMISIVKK